MTVEKFRTIPREQALKFVRECSSKEFEELCKNAITTRHPLNAIEGVKNEGAKRLIKLVVDNPVLPIISLVATEVVGGDDYGYWLGNISRAVVEMVYTTSDGVVYFYKEDNTEEVLTDALGYDWEDKLETEKEIAEAYESLPWKEVIAVYIEAGADKNLEEPPNTDQERQYDNVRQIIANEVSQFLQDAGFEAASKAVDCEFDL